MSSANPAKRARSAAACRRCKHRKQRCDNAFPSCSACVFAGESCSYESKIHPPEYVESLEARVAELQHLLEFQSQRHQTPISHPGSQMNGQDRNDADHQNRGNTNADTAFDMLSSASFFGTSSGFPLVEAVKAVIGPMQRDVRGPSHANHQKQEPSTPDDDTGRELVQVYLDKVHPKHPFLSSRRILALHAQREALRNPSPHRTNDTRSSSFALHMIYAIGARYHQLSQNDQLSTPQSYFNAAMEDIASLFQCHTLESVEGMLLLIIYQLRSPTQPGIWPMAGMTVRHAVSLGLHRKFKGPVLVDQRRKRLFWTIYMVERSIARTMGRPVCLSDRDIDVDLPMDVNEDEYSESGILSGQDQVRPPSALSATIHIFRLARIESKIYSSVHRVDRPISDVPASKIARLRQLLDDWKDQIPDYVSHADDALGQEVANYYSTGSYQILHYHLALLLLLLPRLTTLTTDHVDFRLCITSAGQVCQLYKRLHDRQRTLSYSMIALHATFVAGLTLIYCFVADSSIMNVQFSSDIRACSTVLYVISERWPAARKVREAFERMLSLTVEKTSFPEPYPSASPNQFDTLWSELAGLNPDPSFDIWNALGPWLGANGNDLLDDGSNFVPFDFGT